MTIAAIKPRYMPWVDLLTKVHQPILYQRDRIADILELADSLEARAAGLRKDAQRARALLLIRLLKTWSQSEVKEAAHRAESMTHPIPLHCIEDAELRGAIRALEGAQSPLDVLNLFHAQVIRQHNLLSTATEAERNDTLRRALNWWNFAVLPMLERMGL